MTSQYKRTPQRDARHAAFSVNRSLRPPRLCGEMIFLQ